MFFGVHKKNRSVKQSNETITAKAKVVRNMS